MLGDINPQSVRIAQQAVVYPGRNHVNALTIKRYDGRRFEPVNLTDITRVVLAFPSTDPTVVFDSAVDAVFTWAGNTLTVDLSEYAMPASILPSYLIVFDAEHPQGQVLVDDIDARLEFDFRLVPITGTTPPPTADFLTDSPQDGETYGRKDGAWVPLAALVSGVASVNGQSGVVVLDAAAVGAATAAQGALADSAVQPADLAAVATSGAYADLTGRPNIPATPGDIGAATAAQGALADSAVQPADLAAVATSGAYADLSGKPSLGTAAAENVGSFDPAGAAVAAVGAHEAASDPHPQYQTQAEGDARYERGLTAGANVTIDRTNPNAPVINATGGGTGEANTASSVGAGVSLYKEKVGVDLRFKTLVAGTHIGLVEGTDTVTINASGGGGSSAVDSVNGETGDVVLDAADVGADPAGTAAAAVAAHVAAADPHPQYLTLTEGNAAYAPLTHVGAGGGAHAAAVSGGAAGFMSGSDKAKLDGVAAGATANSADATLLDRENHTGTQAISTVNGLQSALDDKQAALVSGTNIKTINGESVLGSGDLTVSGGAAPPVVQSLTSSRTLALADANTFNVNNSASAYTVTIPAQATVAWAADTEVHFLRSGAGAITLTAAAGVSINGVVAASVTMNVQHGAATLKRVGVDAWWLGGLVASAAEQRAAIGLGEGDAVVVRSLGVGGAQNAAGVWTGLTVRNDTPGAPGPSVEIANNQPVLAGLIGSLASTDLANSADFRRGAEVRFIRDGGADLSRGNAVQFMTRKGDATGGPTRRLMVLNDGNIFISRTTGTPSAAWFGSGEGVFAVGSAAVDPTASPDAGALIYSSGGRLVVRGASDSAPIVLGHTVLDAFTLATLPAASANPRRQVYVSNLAGQAAPVFSDGTNWRRIADNTIAN